MTSSGLQQLGPHQIGWHVRTLGWIHLLSNAVLLVIGGGLFVMLSGIGLLTGDATAVGILTIVGVALAGLMMVLGLPGMLAGYGLLRGKPWGRLLALVVGILGLANVPVGTAIGAYTIWVLFQRSAEDHFTRGLIERA